MNGATVYTIQGSVPGYNSGIMILPGHDIALAYGLNIESYGNWGIRDVLSALVLDQPVAPANLRPATHQLTGLHLDAAGLYSGHPFGPAEITPTEGGLDLVITGPGWRFFLTPTGPDALNWRFLNVDLTYERDEAGRVTALSATDYGLNDTPSHWRMERTDLPALPPEESTETGSPSGN